MKTPLIPIEQTPGICCEPGAGDTGTELADTNFALKDHPLRLEAGRQ